MDGSTYVKAQLMIDGLHGKLREIDCFPAQPPCSAKEFEEAPISSRWQELRAKFKAVESQTSSAIPLSPLSHSAMNNTNNYKTDRRFDSMTSPILKKPTTSSRQPVSAASPLSQRTSILNKEAERLMER